MTYTAEINGSGAAKTKYLPDSYYSDFFSDTTKTRKPSPIRGLFPLEATPGLISLLAGKPNPSTFPFKTLNFTAQSPTDASPDTCVTLTPADLAEGLQYGATAGMPRLVDWLIGLQEHVHKRKFKDGGWSVSMGTGSQDLIFKAVACMVNPGDAILVESPVYAGVIPMFENLHCDQIEVKTDAHGICSSSLRAILSTWPTGKPKPKILYTVPYGCNPTGMTATLERRKEVLELAREHDIIILEDDPYYYLYYGKAPRYPSYFELELEQPEAGRVLRFDSFSKVLSAGIRIGFASGPIPLLNAIERYTATSNLQTSSLTQVIVYGLLNSWGYEGLITHTQRVAEFYREKRDVFERSLRKHLDGLAEWSTPEAGMFFWFRLLLDPTDKDADGDSESIIRTKAFENGVLALPGTVFLPNGQRTAYVRASFSVVPEEDVDEAIYRLKKTILEAREAASSGV